MEERDSKSAKADSTEATAASISSTPPPVSERKPESNRGDAGDGEDKLDVCSDRFDPLLALYSPAVQLPFPNIKCFNNVAEYESFLKGGRGRAKPENVEKKRLKATKGVADPERIERLKKLMVNNPVSEQGDSSGSAARRKRQKPPKNVLTRMPCRFSRHKHTATRWGNWVDLKRVHC